MLGRNWAFNCVAAPGPVAINKPVLVPSRSMPNQQNNGHDYYRAHNDGRNCKVHTQQGTDFALSLNSYGHSGVLDMIRTYDLLHLIQ